MLQEEHSVLKVHGLEFRSKLKEKGSTHVAVELREAVLFRKVGVVEPHYLVNVKFSGELAGYPPIGEIHESNINLLKVREDFSVDLFDHSLHFI